MAYSRRLALGLSLFSLVALACGDDDSPGGIDAAPGDGATADSPPPPDAPLPIDADLTPDAAPPLGIGGLCPNGSGDCGPGQLCLDENLDPNLPPDGYCSMTCTSDADCGGDAFCSPMPVGGPGSPRLCFQKCLTDATGCAGAPSRVCSESFGGLLDLGQLSCVPGDPTKVDGSPCAGFIGSCNVNQACFNNPFEAPGGMCITLGCTVGDDSTCAPGGDGTCINGGGNLVCVDQCTASSECREAEGYSCTPLPGLGSMVCFFLHADTGSACAVSTDCGAAGSPWTCLTGATFPGGYCSGALGTCDPADQNSCPNDGTCYDPSPMPGNEYCIAQCIADTDCRDGEGYLCLPLDPLDPMGPKGCKYLP